MSRPAAWPLSSSSISVIAHLIPVPATHHAAGMAADRHLHLRDRRDGHRAAAGLGVGADRPHGDGGQRHADARGAGRVCRAVRVAGAGRDADREMMLDSGLARRIALLFVRAVGKTSLGIAYALLMTDVTLASGVPSITARSAGMVLPVGPQHR